MKCRQCGREVLAGKAFCAGCGAATGTARTETRPRRPASGGAPRAPGRAEPGRAASGLSIWWIIIPTVVYAALSLDPGRAGALAGLGLVLKIAQGWSGLPAGARIFLPLIQPVAVFLLLGGSVIPVAVTAVLGAVAVHQRDVLVPALESWWRLQQALPRGRRYVLAMVFTLAVGYGFGYLALVINRVEKGHEWTVTYVSVTVGTVVTFLFTFDPPAALRQRRGARPGRREQ